jgi:hypothetical protein
MVILPERTHATDAKDQQKQVPEHSAFIHASCMVVVEQRVRGRELLCGLYIGQPPKDPKICLELIIHVPIGVVSDRLKETSSGTTRARGLYYAGLG